MSQDFNNNTNNDVSEELESDLIVNDGETGTEESNEIEVDYE